MNFNNIKENKIAVIGLGYVGLPLAVEFGKNGFDVTGYDINYSRIEELKKGVDITNEVSEDELRNTNTVNYTSEENELGSSNIFIITVPTPIDEFKQPNLKPLEGASKLVGKYLSKGDIVIYESTVYPGCTEEVCVPVLEKYSGLKFNLDFFCGYSPERINPGDKIRRVHNIIKVTSGSNEKIAEIVDQLYRSIVTAGTHKASSIKVAEAAKIIENSQRDINIAFVNELAIIFEKLGIDTLEVLEAAGTKWNFLPFKPGLVGGHCIGVDPYYLTHKAQSVGHLPNVILSGRRINDGMGKYIADRLVKLLIKQGKAIRNIKVTILGITFKENCPDIRNTRVIDIVEELQDFGVDVEVYDDNASKDEVKEGYGIDLVDDISKDSQAIILAVAHDSFKDIDFNNLIKQGTLIFDVKGFLNQELAAERL